MPPVIGGGGGIGGSRDYQPTHFVAANATGSGNGTAANPWSLEQAMQSAVAGNVVEVRPGIYTGSGGGGRFGPSFNPSNSGTANEPIIFYATNAAGSQYQAGFTTELRSRTASMGQGNPAFGSNGANYVIFDGFFVDERNSGSCADTGPVTLSGVRNCEIRSCVIRGVQPPWQDNHCGVRLEFAQNCVVSDCFITGFDTSGSQNSAGVMTYDSDDCTIEHCEIVDNGCGIFWKGDHRSPHQQGGTVTRFNVFRSNRWTDLRYGGVYDFDNPNLCYGNLFLNSPVGAINLTSYDNLSPAALWIVNNTAVGVREFIAAPGTSRDTVVRNNIVSDVQRVYCSFSVSQVSDFLRTFSSIDTNLYHNYGSFMYTEGSGSMNSASFSSWRSTYGQDVGGINGQDPSFRNRGAEDFRLASQSPGTQAGADVLGLASGGAIDLGCHFGDASPGPRYS